VIEMAALGMTLKRAMDLLIVLGTAPVWIPLLVIGAVAIAVSMGRPIVFAQLRPGRMGRPFALFKLRTMTEGRNRRGEPLPDGQRLTRVGRVLRAWSLDELPSLWNVLKGDMSLVGPRPLLMQYLDRYTPEQARRHELRPGITGWAQVNGRNALSWEEKLALDVWYVDNVSFWIDVKILAMTVWKVVRREGISAAGHVTMPEFTGGEVD
jgi:lipopolysaccharide/colanic/teichoic acid biosynthesis glycosyltransferase